MELPDNVKVEKRTDGAFINITVSFDKENVLKAIQDYLEKNDIQKVIHAHWEKDEPNVCNEYQCSNCREVQNRPSSYCPDCGAKMDEVIK